MKNDNEHATDGPVLRFPHWYDERTEFETPQKGYFDHAVVEASDGTRYAVHFTDPVRLQQDLEEYARLNTPYFAAPGLIVLPEVTTHAMRDAVRGLWRSGYFESLRPMTKSELVAAGN